MRVLAIEDLFGRHVLERADDAIGRRELVELHVDRDIVVFVLDEATHAQIDEHRAPRTAGDDTRQLTGDWDDRNELV